MCRRSRRRSSDFDAAAWVILFAPAGTPPAIVERMAQETGRALQDPEVRAKLADIGATVVASTPAAAAAFHRKELEKFKRAVELSGASADDLVNCAIPSPAMRPSAKDCARPLPGR